MIYFYERYTQIIIRYNMMNFDIDAMDLSELKQLQRQVEKAITSFEDRKRKEAMEAVETAAREHGFTVAELTGLKTKKARSQAVAKYKHPENPSLTWTGKGRRPSWFIDALENGKTPEDLEI